MVVKSMLSRRHFIKGTSLTAAAMASASGVPLFEHLGTKITEEPRRYRELPNPFLLTEMRVAWDPEEMGRHQQLELKADNRVIVPSVDRYSRDPVWSWRPSWGQWIDLSGAKYITITTHLQPVEALMIGVGTKEGKPVIIEPKIRVKRLRA